MFRELATNLRLGLMLALVCAGVGCASDNVWVYVDNGGKENMVVTVDGNEEASIPPGEFARIECLPGERKFHVQCGANVVFDGTKDLVKSDEVLVGRRYFFNPDNRNRYAVYTVKYGSSALEGLFEGKGDRRGAIRAAYKKLAAEVKLLSPEPWFEAPRGAYVLTRAPEVVVTRGGTERRAVMTRVTPKDYNFLKAAQKNTNPSEKDLEALEEVVDRVSD